MDEQEYNLTKQALIDAGEEHDPAGDSFAFTDMVKIIERSAASREILSYTEFS